MRKVTVIVLLTAIVIFVYGLFADRSTPYTDQSAVQSSVIMIAPDVSGRVTHIGVRDNQLVRAGDVLFTIDNERYEIAVQAAQAQLSNAGQSVGASTANVVAAEARLAASEATLVNARAQSERVFELVRRGVSSASRGDDSRASVRNAIADVARSRAELEQARQSLGPTGADNPQIRQAQAALSSARRDMADTVVRAPSNGRVTNLQLAPGRFAAGGQAVMTFVENDAVWIEAEFRENSLEHIKVGDPVSLVLDVRPGRVYPGKVDSVGWGIDNRDTDPQTGLPTVTNDSGWVRDPQRFVVRIRLDPAKRPADVRVGSQASVIVYTGQNGLTDFIGRLWIWLVSWLAYLN
ncbi:HlyD family secretion protein [Brevundimonas sp. Root1423]|uniref:HlyD family secretion protein n=1 Tax=Brevundimonas sp. Root1423 TaxID=1736462 RepID=UPI00138F2DE9|nr:HlyD family secretion protein [Brevundimonas sp. Root1423]